MTEIPVRPNYVAIVDDEDVALVSTQPWCHLAGEHNRTIYATSRWDGRNVFMHKIIMGDPSDPNLTVDHIDGNGLNNRRANLRWATRQQQAWNKAPCKNSQAGFKGVEINGRNYRARIMVAGQRYELGTFQSPEDAALAYNAAAVKYFGEFARLNVLGVMSAQGTTR